MKKWYIYTTSGKFRNVDKNTNNLTHIWRKFNQDKQQFTWRRKDKTQV